MTQLSVVLPCYNEAAGLAALLERYRLAAPAGLDWELVLVENGSRDASAEVLKGLLQDGRYRFARMVAVPVNQGYGYGIHQGLLAAKGEALAFSHADLQCPPEDLFKAHALWAAQRDPQAVLVKGRRQGRGGSAALVTAGQALLASLILRMPLSDINAQPKLFPRRLLAAMQAPPPGFEYDTYVLARAHDLGLGRLELPVVFGERLHGKSSWSFSVFSRWRTMLKVFKAILAMSRGRA